jgi:CRISP-associated protein Cas1
MSSRIIEITSEGKHLSLYRGFMQVSEAGRELMRIPLDDILAVIGNAYQLSYSNNLLIEFAKRRILFVFCGSNHHPIGFLWSVDGFHQQSARMDAQINCMLPKRKQIWKQIVIRKIEQQASLLRILNKNDITVQALVSKVKSGDPDNIEAQAARRYWQLLFGDDFRRDRDKDGVNSLLNYSYMIIRSAVARSIMAAGLHPTISIHHKNANNPMRLVDDMIEPFRVYADYCVWNLCQKGFVSVDKDTKPKCVEILDYEVEGETGLTSLRLAIGDACISLAKIFEGERETLILPKLSMPLLNRPVI